MNQKTSSIGWNPREVLSELFKIQVEDLVVSSVTFNSITCKYSPTWDILLHTILNRLGVPFYLYDDYIYEDNQGSIQLIFPKSKNLNAEQLYDYWMKIEVIVRRFSTKKKYHNYYVISFKQGNQKRYLVDSNGLPRLFDNAKDASEFCNGKKHLKVEPAITYRPGDTIQVLRYGIDEITGTIRDNDGDLVVVNNSDPNEVISLINILNKQCYQIIQK